MLKTSRAREHIFHIDKCCPTIAHWDWDNYCVTSLFIRLLALLLEWLAIPLFVYSSILIPYPSDGYSIISLSSNKCLWLHRNNPRGNVTFPCSSWLNSVPLCLIFFSSSIQFLSNMLSLVRWSTRLSSIRLFLTYFWMHLHQIVWELKVTVLASFMSCRAFIRMRIQLFHCHHVSTVSATKSLFRRRISLFFRNNIWFCFRRCCGFGYLGFLFRRHFSIVQIWIILFLRLK